MPIYLHYFETGRVAYLQALGIAIDVNTIQHENRVVVARNEIDYRSPARFNETLVVLTRIAELGRTSFTFEGWIEERQHHGSLQKTDRCTSGWTHRVWNLFRFLRRLLRRV